MKLGVVHHGHGRWRGGWRGRGRGGGYRPYYDQPVIVYDQPLINVMGPGTCVVEEEGNLPKCFGRWVRQANGRWCCVSDVGI